MREAVMISIQPKWVAEIASGKKTIEVRKTKPKLKTPFKCYIYQTKKRILIDITRKGEMGWCGEIAKETRIISCPDWNAGKVIGEFVCDSIDEYTNYSLDEQKGHIKRREDLLRSACMTLKDWQDYIGSYRSDKGYAWHISNLVIYDKPKELSEFMHYKYFDWWDFGHHENKRQRELCNLTRPPQSWCYVEEQK